MATTEVGYAVPEHAHEEHPSAGIMAWITTVDHKKVGILYLCTAFGFFLVAGVMALLIRTQLSVPNNHVLTPSAYNEVFTMHGTLMIYLFSVPIFTGLANFVMPLQIGAPDVAFPRLNALSYWLFLFGALSVVAGFLTSDGAASATWINLEPLGLSAKTPGAGMDLWLLGLFVTGIASIIGSVNLLATVLVMRVPGMTMFRMPLFTWGVVVTQTLILLAFPVLGAGLIMAFLERRFGGLFFNGAVMSHGTHGDPVLWLNLFWFFGHPEVYIVVMPGFGIISEIIQTFSSKPIFGYRAMVFAFFAIAALSFSVWAHHMFTTGAVNLVWFSFMTMLIAVPTGIKMFNWLGTMWRGHLRMDTPMLFALGFMFVFLIGGITGVFLASPPIDFEVHDTYYVVAHFHYVMLAALEFALFGGLTYWMPKMTGRLMNERLGRISFWFIMVGFNVTFFPMFILGLEGMPRRIQSYQNNLGWNSLNALCSVGAVLIAIATMVFVYNFIVSCVLKRGERAGNDPWHAATLEWATTSPPPHHNFYEIPPVYSERPLFDWVHGLGPDPDFAAELLDVPTGYDGGGDVSQAQIT